jgi:hypothetical protein
MISRFFLCDVLKVFQRLSNKGKSAIANEVRSIAQYRSAAAHQQLRPLSAHSG